MSGEAPLHQIWKITPAGRELVGETASPEAAAARIAYLEHEEERLVLRRSREQRTEPMARFEIYPVTHSSAPDDRGGP
jgi:hypothetical protein